MVYVGEVIVIPAKAGIQKSKCIVILWLDCRIPLLFLDPLIKLREDI